MREFHVGFRALEVAAAIADVRFEVSPILRCARPREFFYAGTKPFTQSRIIDVCAIHRDDGHFFRQTFVDVQIESDGTSLRQARSPFPPKITNAQEAMGREITRGSFR